MRKYAMLMVTIGMLLIAVAIVIPIFRGIDFPAVKYIYAAGALLTLIGRLADSYQGKNLRLRRLHRIETWSAAFFCVAAFFLFYSPGGTGVRDAIAFTLAGGIIQAYTSIMIPRIKD